MVAGVGENSHPGLGQSLEHTGVRGESGAEQDRIWVVQEGREATLDVLMRGARPGGQPRSTRPDTEGPNGLPRCLDDFAALGKTKIIRGTEQDPGLTVDDGTGSLG